jgi:hypothetical protein
MPRGNTGRHFNRLPGQLLRDPRADLQLAAPETRMTAPATTTIRSYDGILLESILPHRGSGICGPDKLTSRSARNTLL